MITKMVNGIETPLTPQEQLDYSVRLAAAPALQAAETARLAAPDLVTQVATLIAALIVKGVLTTNDLPIDVITVINTKLTGIGKGTIKITKQGL